MQRWLVLLSLLGAVAAWAVRLAVELSKPPELLQDGPAPDWEPWWTMSRALDEEGLVPPPV